MWLLHNRIVFLLAFFCSTLFFTFVFTTSITQTQNQDVVGDDGDMPDTSGLLPDTMDPVESVSEPIKIVDGLKNADGKLIYDALNDPRVIDIITVDNDDGTKSHYGFVASKGDSAIQFIDILSVFRNNPIESVHIFDNDSLKLNAVIDVDALSIDDDVYAIAVSTNEGVQALRLDKNQNGSFALTPAGNIDYTSGDFYLGGSTNISTATINSTPYAFVSSSNEGGVQALRLDKNQDKSLTLTPAGKIADADDPDNLVLNGASKSAITKIGTSTYALVASEVGDGVQALRLDKNQNGSFALTPAGSIKHADDSKIFGLFRANAITTTTINGTQYALVASRGNGGQILDLSDPNSPTVVGSGLVFGGGWDLTTTTINGTQYVLVASDGRVQIIDLTDLSSPQLVAGNIVDTNDLELDGARGITTTTIGTKQYALVAFYGTWDSSTKAYVDSGVQILDISNPNSPVAVGNIVNTADLALGYPRGITTTTIDGTQYALVASDGINDPSTSIGKYVDSGVQIIDISNPNSPTVVGSGLVLSRAWGITTTTIDGTQYALVASKIGMVQIIDISNPNSPTAISSTSVRDATGITTTTIDGTQYALVTSFSDSGVQIIDITNPSNPQPVSSITDGVGGFNTLGGAEAITTTTIDGTQYALVASLRDNGVQIIGLSNKEISNEISPTAAGNIVDTNDLELDGAYGITTTTIAGTPYAFVSSNEDDGVQALRLDQNSDKSLTLTPVGNITDNNDLVLDGPIEIITTTIKGIPYAFITSERDNGVQVLDISDPTSLIPVATISDGENGFMNLAGVWGIDIETINNTPYAFVASSDDDAVQIINISDIRNLSAVVDAIGESKTSIVVDKGNNIIENQENVIDSALRFFQEPSSLVFNLVRLLLLR